MPRRSRRPVPAVLVTLLLGLLLVPGAGAADYASTALNIIPSGQQGGLPVTPEADVQAKMYDGLTPLFDQVTPADLTTYFKQAGLGAAAAEGPLRSEAVPRAGVTIQRDRYDVPHITGRTRDDVTWATGWVLQQDRGLLLAQGRYPGRIAALDVPGIDAFSLVRELKTFTPTAAADRRIELEQTAALRAAGPDGRALLHDIDVYLQGINARMRAEKSTQKPFTRADIYGVNALLGQIFGEGGGDEARRSTLLSSLRRRLGTKAGTTVWEDLTTHLDPGAPATMTKRFPYLAVPERATGNAVLDPGSLDTRATRAARAQAAGRGKASNFLMVGRGRSAGGHPLFVAGPQIGYYYPGLTLEVDLKGPGFEARGASAPGFPGNVLIGRGPDFAWSLTSAGSDLIDHYVETLCGGSRTRYRYKGRCRAMTSLKVGKIKGEKGDVAIRSTVHGPVLGYAKVGGRTVAISRKRSSRGKDVLFQLVFRDLTLNRVRSPQTFFKAAARSPFTFNAAYADHRDIAVFSAGLLPRRDPRVDPRLPTKGTGEYEWRGFLTAAQHPQEVAAAGATLVNWNNKPAPGFGSSDSEWTYGPVQRVDLLSGGLAARPTHDLASVTAVMNKAATQDLRGTALVPLLARVLAGSAAPSPRAQAALDALVAWSAAGASRLDRDLDGAIDAGPGPAIVDAAYEPLVDAVLGDVLGAQARLFAEIEGRVNGPRSGFTGGRLNHVVKDLRTVLGDPVRAPMDTRFCGRGNLAACRTALWSALDAATASLEAAQGADVGAWRADATKERISFAPGLLPTTIRYTNRPSGIQQVIEFSGHRPR